MMDDENIEIPDNLPEMLVAMTAAADELRESKRNASTFKERRDLARQLKPITEWLRYADKFLARQTKH